jgi:drug/metabolite transporter (DMT)-like permease
MEIVPFALRPALAINFRLFDTYTWFSVIYIILGTTFLAYFFINYSLKRLPSSVIAYYTYLQPVLVATIGILMFAEQISWVKIVSALLVFGGIYFVTKKKKA